MVIFLNLNTINAEKLFEIVLYTPIFILNRLIYSYLIFYSFRAYPLIIIFVKLLGIEFLFCKGKNRKIKYYI